MSILMAFVASVIGVLPILVGVRGRSMFTTAFITAGISILILSIFFYLVVPSVVWPWWGWIGTSIWILFIISAVIAAVSSERRILFKREYDSFSLSWLFPIVLTFVFGMSWIIREWTMFNASHYASMLGDVETRVWTQDVQPKDPRHIRMSSLENASQLARQVLGQGKGNAIGSQFSIDEGKITLQKIQEKFWWVAPLDFNGWLTWRAAKKVPGYVLVSAEDPTMPGELKLLPEDQKFIYTPGAYWSNDLERHLWSNGYYDKALTDYSIEIDDEWKAWWVITVYKPTAFYSAQKMEGVAVVDPVTGAHQFYKMGDIPSWIDRMVPQSFIADYIDWRGKYHSGWVNSWSGKQNLTQSEVPNLIYGSDGDLWWAIGVTSTSYDDMSLIGLYYTHSRTGKTIFYRAEGSTDEAVIDAVNKNSQVQFKHLHATDPQLYNVYGTMASIVPLLNERHLFQGVAIVNIKNIQIIGVGKDQFEALTNYQNNLSVSGHQIAPDLTKNLRELVGVVDRFIDVIENGETTFYVHIEEVPHLFSGNSRLSPKLSLTQKGDRVRIKYYASGEQVEPMSGFDNDSLTLKGTETEMQIKNKN